jgi:hypothetical protein
MNTIYCIKEYITIYGYAIKYWLQGDTWSDAMNFAETIVLWGRK